MKLSKLFILILGFFILQADVLKEAETDNKAVKSESILQEPEYVEFYYVRELRFHEYEDVKKKMPETLEKYLGNALINDTLIEDLLKIEAEYQILDGDEKKQFLDRCNDIYLLSYEYYMGEDSDDIWYFVDFDEKDDIVIWNQTEEYLNILVFLNSSFENNYFYAPAVQVARTRKDQPYFICWEGKNYLAIPYWDDSEEKIIGVSVHIYHGQYDVVGIGIDENSRITTCYQSYNLGAVRGGEPWYQIKPYREKEKYAFYNMLPALGDPVIDEYYRQDIENVEKLPNGDIEIWDYNFDLNDDGVLDKIITICSPLHSGEMGDTLQILLNDGNDNYETIFDGNYPLYTQDESRKRMGNINILNNKTNGFYDIEIISGDNETIIKYEDGEYR